MSKCKILTVDVVLASSQGPKPGLLFKQSTYNNKYSPVVLDKKRAVFKNVLLCPGHPD